MILDTLNPALQRLIENVESSLHVIARENMTREQAIEIRGKIARALGVLCSKHSLVSDRDAKQPLRKKAGEQIYC